MDEVTMTEAVQRLYMRNYSSLAAMGVLLADYSATYESELTSIWKKPVTYVRVLFFLSRYLAIFGQGINCYVILRVLSPDRIPIDEKLCRRWVNYQVILALALHFVSGLILAKRIVGLYNYHRRIRYGVLVILVVQMICLVAVAQIETSKFVWNTACEVQPQSVSLVGTAITAVLLLGHSLIWFLTTSKRRITLAIILPFTSISLRDGAWAALFYMSIFLAVIPYSAVSNSIKTETHFAWPTTLMSIMTCRLILNTREEYLDDDLIAIDDVLLDGPKDSCDIQDTVVHL